MTAADDIHKLNTLSLFFFFFFFFFQRKEDMIFHVNPLSSRDKTDISCKSSSEQKIHMRENKT